MELKSDVLDVLLSTDPSIAFQTKRDLLNKPKEIWEKDQLRVFTLGWGKQLLDLQEPTGRWGVKADDKDFKKGKGLYGPKYTSTHYTLLLLRRMEMSPCEQTTRGCEQLVQSRYIQSVFDPTIRQKDLCIPSMALGIFAHFQANEDKLEALVQHLADEKVDDGGWNCRSQKSHTGKVTHFSLNTTISALEALACVAKNYPDFYSVVKDITRSAHEVLLEHELFKSHKTGEVIHSRYTDITFPPRWRYNILSALDYFQSIGYPYDNRMQDAIVIIKAREEKGFWPKGKQISGKKHFTIDYRKPSSFNTLRALRVLKMYDN